MLTRVALQHNVLFLFILETAASFWPLLSNGLFRRYILFIWLSVRHYVVTKVIACAIVLCWQSMRKDVICDLILARVQRYEWGRAVVLGSALPVWRYVAPVLKEGSAPF